MNEEVISDQWMQLYSIAIKIRDMAPWEYLNDLDLITLDIQESEEPIICSIIGKNSTEYGVGIYNGIRQIHNLYSKLNSNEMPVIQLGRYDDKIVCHFDRITKLYEEEKNIISEFGLIGDLGNIPYFRKYQPEYMPCNISKEDVIHVIKILNNLYYALVEYSNGLEINFKVGETLRRSFDNERNQWKTYVDKIFTPEITYKIPIINDEILIKRLQRKSKTNTIIELDIAYLNKSAFNNKEIYKDIMPRVGIIGDLKGNVHLSEKIIVPSDNIYEIVLNLFIKYILDRGKPSKVVVRDIFIESIITDLCKTLGIVIEISQKLYTIDQWIEEIEIEENLQSVT